MFTFQKFLSGSRLGNWKPTRVDMVGGGVTQGLLQQSGWEVRLAQSRKLATEKQIQRLYKYQKKKKQAEDCSWCEGAKDENQGSGLCCWVSFFSDKELEKNQIAKHG